MPDIEGYASSGVKKKPDGGVRIYDLIQRFEADHIADNPRPTLLSDLRNYLHAKGYGNDLMQMVFPDVPKPKNYPSFTNEVRPLRLFFDAEFYFDKNHNSLGLANCMQHGYFMLEGNQIYHNMNNAKHYAEYKESIDRYFINHQHQLQIFKDAVVFLLNNNGEKLSQLLGYLSHFATGPESAGLKLFGKMGATSMMNTFVAGLDEKFALANKQMTQQIELINQYQAKIEKLRTEINRDIPFVRDVKDISELFKLENQTLQYAQRLEELRETRKQFAKMLDGIEWYTEKNNAVNVASLLQDCRLNEELVDGTLQSTNILIKAQIKSCTIDVTALMGEGREHATVIARHLHCSIQQYNDMLTRAIEQEQKTYALLNSEQQRQIIAAQTNEYHNKIKAAVNEQQNKSTNASPIYDMSIGEVATRSGMAQQARALHDSTNPTAIKKLAGDCTQALKRRLAAPNISEANKQQVTEKIAALANRVREIDLYTAAFNQQQAVYAAKSATAHNNLGRLRKCQDQCVTELARIAEVQRTNKANEQAAHEAAKINLPPKSDIRDHLTETQTALSKARAGVQTYLNEKIARESNQHKVAAAKNLLSTLDGLLATVGGCLNNNLIQSSDVIVKLKIDLVDAKASFITEHDKSEGSTFKFSNLLQHNTMHKDKVIKLLDGLMLNVDRLYRDVTSAKSTATPEPHALQPSTQRRMMG